MVSIKSLAVATLAAVPTVMCKVDSFKAPAEAAAGSDITATFTTSIYSQNWVDYGVVFSLQLPADTVYANTIGTQIGKFIPLTGDEALKYPYTFDLDVTIPEDTAAGDYVLRASIPYLVGASGLVGWDIINSNITIS